MIRRSTLAYLIGCSCLSEAAAQPTFPPGGYTPVFNEITIFIALAPTRPAPRTTCDGFRGACEKLLMQNPISESGIVQPTIFYRGNTVRDPNTGLFSQVLWLAKDAGLAQSSLLGGELRVAVRPPDAATLRGLPIAAVRSLRADLPRVQPMRLSRGKIESLSRDRPFPAKVQVPVYYSFSVGDKSIAAVEPHHLEAQVNSIPPDPRTCIHSDTWNLVQDSGLVRMWIRVDCFRFLGKGDFEHRERLSYSAR